MKKPKHEPKAMMAARFQAEARQILANRTGQQSRFLNIAAAKGRYLEPVGRMAG